ncbi:MAG: peptide ABC transporter substrate-binding protein [Treponema sp.]|nr:peptide ABC transporter substrate-binding protein [Treponema sp.]
MKHNLKSFFCLTALIMAELSLYAYAQESKELSVIMSRSNLDLNPHTSSFSDEAQILNSLYEGLFSYNPVTSEPENALVESYKTSRDMLVWTFYLRKDAKFSDGKPITSYNVKESWINLIQTKGAYYSSFLDIIRGAKELRLGKGSVEDVAIFTRDEHTISIELTSPRSYLREVLCHHAFSVIDFKNGAYSGAYVILHHSQNSLVLSKNLEYYNQESVKINQINISFSDDLNENSYLFNTGKVQIIFGNANAKSILDKDSLQFEPLFGTYFFFFKKQKNSVINEKIKQALLEAVPWDDLREGSLFPATTLIYPVYGYTSPQGLNYTDYEHARFLINKAKAEAGLAEDELIELTFSIPEGDSIYQAARILKNAWGEIGVRLNIVTDRDPNYLNKIEISDADLFVYTWIGDFPDPVTFLDLFRSDSSLNISGFSDSKYDSLIKKADSAQKRSERMELLKQAEDILLSSGTIIPLTHPVDLNIVNTNDISGWSANTLGLHSFRHLSFKKPASSFKYGIIASN